MGQRLKEMEDKLLMISEVLRTEEGPELKIQMISELVQLEEAKPEAEEVDE
jgi:hypothetical protein